MTWTSIWPHTRRLRYLSCFSRSLRPAGRVSKPDSSLCRSMHAAQVSPASLLASCVQPAGSVR